MEQQLQPGDLVVLDGKTKTYRVVDFHGPLVRIAPLPSAGRIVHPERLTPAPESDGGSR